MEYKDYYKVLGIDKKSSQADIKRAYRKLARKYHPDVSKAADAEDKFKEVGEAYEVLKDPEKRAAYDQLGENWKTGQSGFQPPPDWDAGFEFHGGGFTGDAGQTDFSDFFESLFGQRPSGHQYQSGRGFDARGEDSHAKVYIDLEDAYHGATRSLNLQHTEIDSTGRPQLKNRTLNVKIPKGVKEGQSIRLQQQGSPGLGKGKAGDLYLEILFNIHSMYSVQGRDVSLEIPITPWEGALGAKIQVPTPAGKVDLKIPPGTSSGKRMRLKGKGIPAKNPGDFYLIMKVVISQNLTEQQKELYQKLQTVSDSFKPRASLGVS